MHFCRKDHRDSKGIVENIYCCFIDYTEAFGFVNQDRLEMHKEDRNTRPLYLFSRGVYIQVKKKQL